MLNSVIIMGRLTADPELRTTPSGVSVTRFTVAVDRRFQRQGEDRQTDFIGVVAWRQTADFVTRFFKKGQMIAVQGSLQVSNYEDKNGNKRTNYDVVADNVSFCGSKSESGNFGARQESAPAEPSCLQDHQSLRKTAAPHSSQEHTSRSIPKQRLPDSFQKAFSCFVPFFTIFPKISLICFLQIGSDFSYLRKPDGCASTQG